MIELAPGLWHWTAKHPEWEPEDDTAGHLWGPIVSCYAVVNGRRVVLIDPVIPDGGLEELVHGRTADVVLTCPWHLRDGATLGYPVHSPADGDDRVEGATVFGVGVGDRPVPGIEALPGLEPADLVLWLPEHQALVLGDSLVDLGNGLELPENWNPKIDQGPVLEQLRTYLDRPIAFALPTHGAPADRAAYAAAVGATS